jgi:BASS family bile acid:Na+ symporter
MSLAAIVLLVLKASIFAIVFSLGLTARFADLIYLLRRPGEFARSVLSMSIVMPIVAFLLVRMLDLPRPAAIMLIALSLAPVPPILPRKLAKAHGDAAYSIGLLVTAALIALVWVPVALEIEQQLFGLPLGMSPLAVGKVIAMTILAPLLAGMLVGRLMPTRAPRLAPMISALGGLLLLAGAVAILASQWRAIFGLMHDGTVLAMAVFVVVGLLAGHLLGGPEPEHRTVLAMATASRHPGVALAIANINFPNENALAAAVLLFLVTNAVLSIPYVRWRRRAGAAGDLALT